MLNFLLFYYNWRPHLAIAIDIYIYMYKGSWVERSGAPSIRCAILEPIRGLRPSAALARTPRSVAPIYRQCGACCTAYVFSSCLLGCVNDGLGCVWCLFFCGVLFCGVRRRRLRADAPPLPQRRQQRRPHRRAAGRRCRPRRRLHPRVAGDNQ